jgi:hypothetical protein
MQPHEGPPEKPSIDRTTRWLILVIISLLGIIAVELLKRFL